VGKTTLAGKMAVDLSSKAVGNVEDNEGVLSTDLDDNRRQRRWLEMVEQGSKRCRAE
jgi:hypothetical protein